MSVGCIWAVRYLSPKQVRCNEFDLLCWNVFEKSNISPPEPQKDLSRSFLFYFWFGLTVQCHPLNSKSFGLFIGLIRIVHCAAKAGCKIFLKCLWIRRSFETTTLDSKWAGTAVFCILSSRHPNRCLNNSNQPALESAFWVMSIGAMRSTDLFLDSIWVKLGKNKMVREVIKNNDNCNWAKSVKTDVIYICCWINWALVSEQDQVKWILRWFS